MKQKIKQELIKLQDQKYKEFHSRLCSSMAPILGIRVPILRNYAKELLKQNTFPELMQNIDDEYYEEIMLQGMLIGLAKEDFKTILESIKNFLPKIDNWAICDVFCAGLKMTKKNQEAMWEFLKQCVKSEQEFEIRFGVVMLLDYFIEEKYLKDIFQILEEIKSQKYYVQMAVAWAISICLIKYYDETLVYLEKANLDTFTYHKALQKGIESDRITLEQKQVLRNRKKQD
ncbi:MAG: DNA alkylation repair protein [Clostridia bacterium]|nr:DNA alkylation repair protein [Clostridia bacterium]